jgi:hypothetical protein
LIVVRLFVKRCRLALSVEGNRFYAGSGAYDDFQAALREQLHVGHIASGNKGSDRKTREDQARDPVADLNVPYKAS